MKKQVKHLQNEPDIGSGEKNPGQQETERMIEQIGQAQRTQTPPDPQQEGKKVNSPPSGH